MTDERDKAGERGALAGGVTGARGAGGTNITGGTDKLGRGALAGTDAPPANAHRVPKTNDPPAEETAETGDIMGATSTHAGAGGVMSNTGGTGTAPTGDTLFSDGDNS